jgi:phosphoribosylformylglycinamidine cyclo-ligase
MEEVKLKSAANITGGGFYENIPRCFHEKVSIKINKKAYEIPAIFQLMEKEGNISEHDMYNTFNMGIGMVAIVSKNEAEKAIHVLEEMGEKAYFLGEMIEGNKEVILE